jgi:hypothetical protein
MKTEEAQRDRKRMWFILGTVLTWTLTIPLIVGMFSAFHGLFGRTLGLGAIAGGLAECYATVGLILAFVIPVGAIILLARSFSGAHPIRALFSLLYICWSALTLAFAGVFVWLTFIYMPHTASGPR